MAPQTQQASLDAPTPRDASTSTFTASWTPSKATAFDAANVPLAKVPKGWERKAEKRRTKGENGKTRTVWKRYGLRSGPETAQQKKSEEEAAREQSPGKVVKKARVASPVKGSPEKLPNTNTRGRRKSTATLRERRKSGYRRKAAATSALDASAAPTFAAPVEIDATEEPVKEDVIAEPEPAKVSNDLDVEVPDASQAQHASQHDDDEVQEDSMCEAAEAQLLTEAGLEPIPADFVISPVKKMAKQVHFEAPPEVEKLEEEQRDDSVMEEEGQLRAPTEAVEYPILPQSQASEGAAAEIEEEAQHDAAGIEEPATPDAKSQTPQEKPKSQGVTYPDIDIFGLDEEDVVEPAEAGAQQAQQDQAQDDEEADDEEEETGGMFAISLNDETVNLGALLAKNDSLSATITDDEIQLEVMELSQEAEEAAARELKEMDGSPVDSPDDQDEQDELSMDIDATETLMPTGDDTFTHLEDDKAKLSSFLKRMAEAKEKKSMSRRDSLQKRRDSDRVRKALASPRPVLEEKDKNLSPTRQSQPPSGDTLNLNQILTSPLVARPQPLDPEEQDELSASYQTGSPRRRSSRSTVRSKLPHFGAQPSGTGTGAATTTTPNKISIRTDGGEKVNLNRTEAQQLADIVRRNTKKNKGSSIPAPQRLAKLKLESLVSITEGESPVVVVEKLLKQGVRNVTWRENLADYATSTATVDLEAQAAEEEQEGGVKAEPKKKATAGTTRLRKMKSLGGGNGTPAKKVLQAVPLPDGPEEDEKEKPKSVVASAASARKKRGAPSVAVAPLVEEQPAAVPEEEKKPAAAATVAANKKSKLQQPKKLNLNPSLTSIGGLGSGLPVLQGKENTMLAGLNSPAKKMSKIPAPSAIPTPSALSMDITSGLRPPVKRTRLGVGKKV